MRRAIGPRAARPPVAQPIEQTRKALRLSQVDVERALGVPPRTLRRWERGEMRPSRNNLARLVGYFESVDAEAGARLRIAVTGVAPPVEAPPSEAALLEAVWRAAEEMNVPARSLRAAVGRVLSAAAAERFTLAAAAAALRLG